MDKIQETYDVRGLPMRILTDGDCQDCDDNANYDARLV